MLYTEINIDEDEAAAQRVEQWNQGNRTIPTLDINGTILTNPSWKTVRVQKAVLSHQSCTGEAMRQRLGTRTVILGKGGSVWP